MIAAAVSRRALELQTAFEAGVRPYIGTDLGEITNPDRTWLEWWEEAKRWANEGEKADTIACCRAVHRRCPSYFWADNLWKHPFGYYSQHEQDFVVEAFFDLYPPASRFFVDVGAFDPKFLSNSRRLVERGWGGVQIEPSPAPAARLRAAAPDRVRVIELACSAHPGLGVLFETDWPGMEPGGAIACLDKDQVSAGTWKDASKRSFVMPSSEGTETFSLPEPRPVQVRIEPLDKLLGDCPQIDVLFVDAETCEPQIFAGFALEGYRPRLIVLETVTRMMAERMRKAGYKFIGQGQADRYFALA